MPASRNRVWPRGADGLSGSPPIRRRYTSNEGEGLTITASRRLAVSTRVLLAGSAVALSLVAPGIAHAEAPTLFTAGAPPGVFGESATRLSATSEQVSAEISPAAQTTIYHVAYGAPSSTWCTSMGGSGSPEHATSPQTLGFVDEGVHEVSVEVNGLSAGSTYCAELIASNASATTAGGQLSFTAGASLVSTGAVQATGAGTVTVGGEVNPVGQTTSYHVAYGSAASTWCKTGGASGSAEHSSSSSTLPFTDDEYHDVTVAIASLSPGSEYCVELLASNASAIGRGGAVSFRAAAPTAVTEQVQPTGATTAELSGQVDPAGQTTTYHAAYGASGSSWCSSDGSSGSPEHTTSPSTLGFTDTGSHPVSIALGGLTAGDSYCAALVATNAVTTIGAQVSVTSSPLVATSFAQATGAATATVSGQVDPAGQSATYEVAYAVAGSGWCASGGSSGSPEHATAPQTLGFSDNSYHLVSVDLSGLSPGSEYCAELVASNAVTASGGQVRFTSRPGISAVAANTGGATAEQVIGDIDPAGQTTSYHVAYGATSSEWCSGGGQSGSPEHTTAPSNLGFTDTSSHPVAVDLGGLSAGESYCAALVAGNASGTDSSAPLIFGAGAPAAYLEFPEATGATTEELIGEVNPAGQATAYHVEYALATSAWCTSEGQSGTPESSTTPQTLGVTDTTVHEVMIGLTGLTSGREYCAELVASNASGTTASGGQVTVFTSAAMPVAPTSETISGEVNPAGQSTAYHVAYGLASSEWCTSAGASGAAERATSSSTLGFTDGSLHPVLVGLSGLAEGTKYCAELLAGNANGIGHGGQVTFTTVSQAVVPAPPTPPSSPAGSAAEQQAPAVAQIGRLRVSPGVFTPATGGPSLRSLPSHKSKTGASVTFTLTETATVAFAVEQSEQGRVGKGGHCVKETRASRRAHRCALLVTVSGMFVVAGRAGANAFLFTGRLAGRALKPGRYVLLATPSAGGRAGRGASGGFQIVH